MLCGPRPESWLVFFHLDVGSQRCLFQRAEIPQAATSFPRFLPLDPEPVRPLRENYVFDPVSHSTTGLYCVVNPLWGYHDIVERWVRERYYRHWKSLPEYL